MTSMNISLSEQMKNWVDAQLESGAYHNVSEYIRDLIRKDQKENAQNAAFVAAINLGRESGVENRNFKEIIDAAKQKAKSNNAP